MDKLDLPKLIKVLGMTGSAHDAEALAALRTAIKMMANAKVSWADILKPVVVVEPKMTHHEDAKPYYEDPIEILRRYRDFQRAQATTNKAYRHNDDLYEALFGKKRNPYK